jgi:hypothetical protein
LLYAELTLGRDLARRVSPSSNASMADAIEMALAVAAVLGGAAFLRLVGRWRAVQRRTSRVD